VTGRPTDGAARPTTAPAETGRRTDDAADPATATELLRLERALAERVDAAAPDGLAALLDDGFLEFGASGRVLDRDATIEMLRTSGHVDSIDLSEVRTRVLAADVVLLTYTLSARAPNGARRTRRSSIWRRTPDGWRILFHQGTVVPDNDEPA